MSEASDHGSSAANLSAYMSPAGAWAFALGTSIGWGSLIVTATSYLTQAGPYGSVIGLVVGCLIMLVIAGSYHFMMVNHPNAGGIYGYVRDIFGYDHGVLIAWFTVLAYIAMFWANATSLVLFSRFFLGDLFQFGFSYQVFGFDVYLGEIVLSAAVIALAGLACTMPKRGISVAMVIMAALICAGVTAAFATGFAQRDVGNFAFDPKFVPGTNPLVQVIHIASISSWAFIGFESISHSSEEFTFSRKHSFKVLAAALVSATVLYCFLILLSVSVYPEGYADWQAYIADMGNKSGIEAVPAFFAVQHFMGAAGVAVFMVVLLCLVFTSLVGNMTSLSRLLYSLSRDSILPHDLSGLNEYGVPSRAVATIVIISLVIPFIGRTAISWIVDVTTLGATLLYGFVSACALKEGRERHSTMETNCGLIGLVLMVAFALYLLLPSVFGDSSMATETYLLFAVWSMLGFVFFRHLLKTDRARRFGRSTITWVVLLVLIMFTSLAWMGQMASSVSTGVATDLRDHYLAQAGIAAAEGTDDYIVQTVNALDATITRGMFTVAGMFMFSLLVMLSNFSIMSSREEQSHQRATTAHTIANTDPLTGVKSKHAYVTKEAELNKMLENGDTQDLGVVVCDVNGLKQVNDTQGHKAGDAYIRAASQLICDVFKHSPVYRIGGDEFVVLLQGEDFNNRTQLMAELNTQVEKNREEGKVVIAAGVSIYNSDMDAEVHAIFERADALMYQRKKQLKRPGEEIR